MRNLPVLALPALLERHLPGYVKTKGTGIVIDVKTQLVVAPYIIAYLAGSGRTAVPGRQVPVVRSIAAVLNMYLGHIAIILLYPPQIGTDGIEVHIVQLHASGCSVELCHTAAVNVRVNPYHYLLHPCCPPADW